MGTNKLSWVLLAGVCLLCQAFRTSIVSEKQSGKKIEEETTRTTLQDCETLKCPYDWTKDTKTNYATEDVKEAVEAFKKDKTVDRDMFADGPYKEIRLNLDHAWHGFYTKERQEWQDEAVKEVLATTKSDQDPPWVIFTAGGFGAGKGYTMNAMFKSKWVDKEDFAFMDPDKFKSMMPEFPLYTEHGQNNGNMCHQESGYMAEVGQNAALDQSSHLMIDGSLQDSFWYTGGGTQDSLDTSSPNWMGEIRRIKHNHPNYRMAIFHMVMLGPLHSSLEAIGANDQKKASENRTFKLTRPVEAELKRRLDGRFERTGRRTDWKKAVDSVIKGAATVEKVKKEGIVDLIVRFNTFQNTDAIDITDTMISESWKQKLDEGHAGANIGGSDETMVEFEGDTKTLLQSQFGPPAQKQAALNILHR